MPVVWTYNSSTWTCVECGVRLEASPNAANSPVWQTSRSSFPLNGPGVSHGVAPLGTLPDLNASIVWFQHLPLSSDGNIIITNARLAYTDKEQASKTWSIEIHGGRVAKVLPSVDKVGATPESRDPSTCLVVDAQGGLLLPSFCHSHIHLDKCFILDKCGDLVDGDFSEAMQVTKAAKSEFPKQLEDLYARGTRIIQESVEHGVTAMRAHVEVDTSVGFACLEAALKLQHEYSAHCDVQIAIFAQEPLFDSVDHQKPGQNFILLEAALRHGVNVVGSAPYVEPSIEQAKLNISLIFDVADARGIDQVDFHLDYNLDPKSEPLIYEVISQAKKRYQNKRGASDAAVVIQSSSFSSIDPPNSIDAPISHAKRPRPCPRITIGHATRLQLLSEGQWRALVHAISDLPIVLVGLPQSDIYMQGRSSWDDPLGAPRGTLRAPYLFQKYGIEIAMSVNNVENAFTPQGSLDPLSLCAYGVGVFQAATPADVRTLARAVTLTSKHAIGHPETPLDLAPAVGDLADFVILHGRSSLQSAVLNPCFDRTTLKAGRIVACKRSARWLAPCT